MSQKKTPRAAGCAATASLLPLADHNLLSAENEARLREHLATCADCRAELALYTRVDVAWQRAFSANQTGEPIVSREALLADIANEPVAIPARSVRRAESASLPAAQRRRPRRVVAGVSALAACLLIAVIVGAALLARGHTPLGAGPQATATAKAAPYQNISTSGFNDISMVSATEGWAVGGTYTAVYNHTTDPTTLTETVLLWHYLNGTWSPIQLPIHGQLQSISMDSPTDGWAIGGNHYDQAQDSTVLLHYDGHTWRQVSSDGLQMLNYDQVEMVSATDGWIVGSPLPDPSGTPRDSGIWHYNGTSWQAEPIPATLSALLQKHEIEISSIAMLSASEGWATAILSPIIQLPGTSTPITTISSSDISNNSVILHYTGGQWEVQRVLSNTRLFSVSLLSATNGWISGQSVTDKLIPDPTPSTVSVTEEKTAPLLLHYTQGQWVDVTSSVNVNRSNVSSLQTVFMLSPTDGWLIAWPSASAGLATRLFHYNGSQWSAVALPGIPNTSGITLTCVVMTSPTDGWLIGNRNVKSSPGYSLLMVPVIYHLHNGIWSVVQG
jgi:hypothetical protein